MAQKQNILSLGSSEVLAELTVEQGNTVLVKLMCGSGLAVPRHLLAQVPNTNAHFVSEHVNKWKNGLARSIAKS